jgi:hypothetical protein
MNTFDINVHPEELVDEDVLCPLGIGRPRMCLQFECGSQECIEKKSSISLSRQERKEIRMEETCGSCPDGTDCRTCSDI